MNTAGGKRRCVITADPDVASWILKEQLKKYCPTLARWRGYVAIRAFTIFTNS
jgi:hypothetical protein